MKHFIFLLLISAAGLVASCSKDEGQRPNISFKTGPVYITGNTSLAATSIVVVGINASRDTDGADLDKFTITKSVNGGSATTVYSEDLDASDADNYSHDFTEVVAGSTGNTIKYTFKITDTDGLSNELTLTVTVL